MTQTQRHSLRIENVEAARALKANTGFLDLFVNPRSPTDIADAAGMAPNLAHHHASKLAKLGLLFEQRRQGRKVYYQLAAREFRVPWSVLPPVDETAGELKTAQDLLLAFSRAYEVSWLAAGEQEEYVAGFGDALTPPTAPQKPSSPPVQAIPTHFEALTLRLTPERYRRLVQTLSQLLQEAAVEGGDLKEQGHVCTLALMAFEGSIENPASQWQGRVSRQVSSFLGAEP